MGTGFLYRGESGRGVVLTTHPHTSPRLNKDYSYTSIPLSAFMACSRAIFTFLLRLKTVMPTEKTPATDRVYADSLGVKFHTTSWSIRDVTNDMVSVGKY
jgi:hypothetical protein